MSIFRKAHMSGSYPRPADERPPDYWISFSDMMSGLLMTFILFLTIILLDYRTVLDDKQHQIDRLLGVKTEIIQTLHQEFGDSDIGLEIDPQTGAIRFQGGVFFDINSVQISESGRVYLHQFIPRYMEIILAERFQPFVAQVIIEGHTDSTGSYLYNLDLSQRRAYAVAHYILSDEFPDFPERKALESVITANGRSYSQPLETRGEIDWERSRRREFKFRLKDDELIDQVREFLTK